MRPAVKIADLTDALVMVSPESTAWLDRDTGSVYVISNHAMAIAEGDAPEDSGGVKGGQAESKASGQCLWIF